MSDKCETIARWFAEHHEQYRWEGTPLDGPNPQGAYVMSIERDDPARLTARSHADHEESVKMWADALRKSGIVT